MTQNRDAAWLQKRREFFAKQQGLATNEENNVAQVDQISGRISPQSNSQLNQGSPSYPRGTIQETHGNISAYQTPERQVHNTPSYQTPLDHHSAYQTPEQVHNNPPIYQTPLNTPVRHHEASQIRSVSPDRNSPDSHHNVIVSNASANELKSEIARRVLAQKNVENSYRNFLMKDEELRKQKQLSKRSQLTSHQSSVTHNVQETHSSASQSKALLAAELRAQIEEKNMRKMMEKAQDRQEIVNQWAVPLPRSITSNVVETPRFADYRTPSPQAHQEGYYSPIHSATPGQPPYDNQVYPGYQGYQGEPQQVPYQPSFPQQVPYQPQGPQQHSIPQQVPYQPQGPQQPSVPQQITYQPQVPQQPSYINQFPESPIYRQQSTTPDPLSRTGLALDQQRRLNAQRIREENFLKYQSNTPVKTKEEIPVEATHSIFRNEDDHEKQAKRAIDAQNAMNLQSDLERQIAEKKQRQKIEAERIKLEEEKDAKRLAKEIEEEKRKFEIEKKREADKIRGIKGEHQMKPIEKKSSQVETPPVSKPNVDRVPPVSQPPPPPVAPPPVTPPQPPPQVTQPQQTVHDSINIKLTDSLLSNQQDFMTMQTQTISKLQDKLILDKPIETTNRPFSNVDSAVNFISKLIDCKYPVLPKKEEGNIEDIQESSIMVNEKNQSLKNSIDRNKSNPKSNKYDIADPHDNSVDYLDRLENSLDETTSSSHSYTSSNVIIEDSLSLDTLMSVPKGKKNQLFKKSSNHQNQPTFNKNIVKTMSKPIKTRENHCFADSLQLDSDDSSTYYHDSVDFNFDEVSIGKNSSIQKNSSTGKNAKKNKDNSGDYNHILDNLSDSDDGYETDSSTEALLARLEDDAYWKQKSDQKSNQSPEIAKKQETNSKLQASSNSKLHASSNSKLHASSNSKLQASSNSKLQASSNSKLQTMSTSKHSTSVVDIPKFRSIVQNNQFMSDDLRHDILEILEDPDVISRHNTNIHISPFKEERTEEMMTTSMKYTMREKEEDDRNNHCNNSFIHEDLSILDSPITRHYTPSTKHYNTPYKGEYNSSDLKKYSTPYKGEYNSSDLKNYSTPYKGEYNSSDLKKYSTPYTRDYHTPIDTIEKPISLRIPMTNSYESELSIGVGESMTMVSSDEEFGNESFLGNSTSSSEMSGLGETLKFLQSAAKV